MNRRSKIGAVLLFSSLILTSVVAGSILLSSPSVDAQDLLDLNIRQIMNERHIPGSAACAVKNGQIVWMKSYGYADLDLNISITNDTLFMLGSVSKIVTGIAFMQLFERGFIDLDDDINDYLPFEIIHPDHPASSITPRMLLSHVSGIHDNWDVLFPLQVMGSDSPISLETFISGYLTSNGTYFQSANYNDAEPGTEFDYTNVGATLIAYLVEILSNTTFEEYCQENIFHPLGMNETSWLLANLDNASIAMPYQYAGSSCTAYGQYGSPVYPCGFMRTSIQQQALLMTMLMEGGAIGDTRILENTTLQLMMTHHYPEIVSSYGLFFQHSGVLWGHGGDGPGVATSTYLYPEAHEGVIVMLNLEDHTALNSIYNAILECMRTAYGWQT